MGKWLVVWCMVTSLVYAGRIIADYTLVPQSDTTPRYFVKIGAYADPTYAHQQSLNASFATQIIHMRDYFSVVSQPFPTRKEALKRVRQIKNTYPDAYIITLYQKAPATPENKQTPYTQLFGQALAAYHREDYEEALMGFDKVMIIYPDDLKAQIYYLRTLVALQIYDEAQERAKALLQSNLTETERQYVETILSHIESGRKKHFFSGFFSLGIGYDDNLNLNTDKKFTRYGPYRLINDTRKTKSTYAIVQLQAAHTYKAPRWQLYTMLYSYHELLHSAKGNDLNFIDLSTSYIKSVDRFRWILPVGFNTSYLDSKQISYNLYTNPTLLYTPSSYWRYQFDILLQQNHSQYATGYDYDLFSANTGLDYHTHHYRSGFYYTRQNYTARKRVRFDVSRDVDRYRYYLEYRFNKQTTSGIGYQYDSVRYSRIDPVMGYRRKDNKHIYTLSLRYQIKPKTTLKTFYRYTNALSNVNTFRYQKKSLSLLYQKRF